MVNMVRSSACHYKSKGTLWNHSPIPTPEDEHHQNHKLYRMDANQHRSPNKHQKRNTTNTTALYECPRMTIVNITKHEHHKITNSKIDTTNSTIYEHLAHYSKWTPLGRKVYWSFVEKTSVKQEWNQKWAHIFRQRVHADQMYPR